LVAALPALPLALPGGGRDHPLALARVAAGPPAIRPGAAALALAGVDTGTVHQLVAGLVLGGARTDRARQDEARGGGRDQQSLSAHRASPLERLEYARLPASRNRCLPRRWRSVAEFRRLVIRITRGRP